MCQLLLLIFIYCSFGIFFSLEGEEASLAISKNTSALEESSTYNKQLNLTVLTLKNGMKIYLKPTDFESDEVIIKMSALGGFSSLDPQMYPSGQLAAQIAWESGMGGMTGDQVSVFLYENCLEFYPKIQAFNRTIDGSASRSGLESFLNCIHMLFTSSNFTKEGFNTALAQAKASIAKNRLDFEQTYEAAFLAANTQNFTPLHPLNSDDLENVRFDVAREFFHHAFSNPQEFICVIVGNFDVDEILPLLKKYLESIPQNEPFVVKKISAPTFPQGITKKIIPVSTKKDSLTRLTFPLSVDLNENNIHLFELTCQIIEARLRRIITEQMKTSHGIDVAYEFPVYPLLESPWMTIQFRSEAKLVNLIIPMILNELKSMQLNGATQKELNEIKKFEQGSDELWLHNNCYWVSVLSNFYLWGWNPEGIQKKREEMNVLNTQTLNGILKSYFSLGNHSIITAQ